MVPGVEICEVEPLAEDEDVCGEVAESADRRLVVTTCTGIGVRTGNSVCISRKIEGAPQIGEERTCTLTEGPSGSLFGREICPEQALTVLY